jgi:hypothetical protein
MLGSLLTTAANSELTGTQIGAFTAIFIIAMAMIKIVQYMIKKKYEKAECSALQDGVCPLGIVLSDFKSILGDMHKLHCGAGAMGKDGIPRWYIPEDMLLLVKEVKEKVDFIHQQILEKKLVNGDITSRHTKELAVLLSKINKTLDSKEKINEKRS